MGVADGVVEDRSGRLYEFLKEGGGTLKNKSTYQQGGVTHNIISKIGWHKEIVKNLTEKVGGAVNGGRRE